MYALYFFVLYLINMGLNDFVNIYECNYYLVITRWQTCYNKIQIKFIQCPIGASIIRSIRLELSQYKHKKRHSNVVDPLFAYKSTDFQFSLEYRQWWRQRYNYWRPTVPYARDSIGKRAVADCWLPRSELQTYSSLCTDWIWSCVERVTSWLSRSSQYTAVKPWRRWRDCWHRRHTADTQSSSRTTTAARKSSTDSWPGDNNRTLLGYKVRFYQCQWVSQRLTDC